MVLLRDALLVGLLVLALSWAALSLRASSVLPLSRRGESVTDLLAGMGVLMLALMLSVRSIEFGVDTIAYVDIFRDYCANRPLGDFDHSFSLSAAMLNVAMIGACDVQLLPVAWVLVILSGAAFTAGGPSLRLRYAALLLGSMVGIELTTNALRQGFAVVFLVAALSQWPQRRALSAGLCILALALHNSMALALLAVGMAALPWRWFVPGMLLAIAAVIASLDNVGLVAMVAQPLIYEITKYMAHEGDEIYVRLLTGTALLATVVCPWLACRTAAERQALTGRHDHGWAIRLACTALPFMLLPYFGYRYVYAILPIVLFLTLRAGIGGSGQPSRHVALLALSNALLLLVWAQGSSYIREVPLGDWLP